MEINWLLIIFCCLYAVTILTCTCVVISENRNTIRTIAWTIALIFLPVIGFVFYLFFGRGLKGMHMISRHNKRRLFAESHSTPLDLDTCQLSNSSKRLVKLVYTICRYPLYMNNRIEIFTTGATKFDSLKEDLRNARKNIYLQYYIFSDDTLGKEIADILIQKVKEGVDVKVLYDHVGSFSARSRFFKRMRDAGIDIHPFFRVTFPQLANRINWRNHRKIIVIDGEIGYIGGMNIADRYVKGMKDGTTWRDTHFRVTGDIVSSLLYSFAIDWSFQHPESGASDIDTQCAPVTFTNTSGMQLATCGPVNKWNNLALCYLQAITNAKKSVYIQTPYFLPTDTLLHALETAALSKVDVRLMIPSKSDSRLLQYASYSYITRCLKAGIRVYIYEPGMIHSKTMTIDQDFVTAGSTNFDFRSFENNFECNLMIYDKEINRAMRDIFFDDLKHCRKLVYSTWRTRPVWQRAMESIVRLMSPIL